MILSPITDPQDYINLCIEIQKEWPNLQYGYNLNLNTNNKIMLLVSKEEKVLYAPFYFRGAKLNAAGRVR